MIQTFKEPMSIELLSVSLDLVPMACLTEPLMTVPTRHVAAISPKHIQWLEAFEAV